MQARRAKTRYHPERRNPHAVERIQRASNFPYEDQSRQRTCEYIVPVFDRSKLLSTERIAARNISRFQAGHKPTRALSRRAMGERIRHHISLRPTL